MNHEGSIGRLKRIFGRVENNVETCTEILQTLVRQPSISARNEGMDECKALVTRMMREIGFRVEEVELENGFPVILGELSAQKKDSKKLLMYNHYDVQPPEPLEEWRSDPFAAAIRDGRIYGRGVGDNKGNIAARLMATKFVLEELGTPPIDLEMVAEGGEEVASPGLDRFVVRYRDRLKADGCLWEGGLLASNGRPELYLGMKGILYVQLKCRTAKVDQHSMFASVIPNPAWRLVWALNSLKNSEGRIHIEGFYDRGQLPSEEDMHLLEQIEFDEAGLKERLGIDNFLSNLTGVELLRALYFNPTCTICDMDTGLAGARPKTVNPREATAKIDFRLVPKQSPEEVLEKLKMHLSKHGFDDIEVVDSVVSMQPCKASPHSDVARAASSSAQLVYGKEATFVPLLPGSGPMHLFVNEIGVPTVGGECVARYDCNFHAPNEFVTIDDYIRAIKHVAAMMVTF